MSVSRLNAERDSQDRPASYRGRSTCVTQQRNARCKPSSNQQRLYSGGCSGKIAPVQLRWIESREKRLPGNLQPGPNRNFAPLLATFCVLVGGVIACAAIVLAAGEFHPRPILIAAGSMVGLIILIWLLRDRPEARKRDWYAWVKHRNARPARSVYEIRKTRAPVEYGTNAPPTLDDLREARENIKTWVPSNSRLTRRDQD